MQKKKELSDATIAMESSTTETDYMLNQAYKNLEEEWDCIKQSKLNLPMPGTLTSPLQQRSTSPSSENTAWKVRTNDLAVMEILRERRAAIECGELKGRNLFEEFEGWNNNMNALNEDCEVRSVSVTSYDGDGSDQGELPVAVETCSSSSCAPVGVCVDVLKQTEDVVEHKRGACRRINVVLVLLAVVFVMCALCITSYRSTDEYEVTLVPT